jgi:hypothetical protein
MFNLWLARPTFFLTVLTMIGVGLLGPANGPVTHANLPSKQDTSPSLLAVYGKLPLAFEANRGQSGAGVQFVAHASNYTANLSPTDVSFSFKDGRDTLRLRLDGANSHARVAATDLLPGYANYFIGNDPQAWQTNVPTYARVRYCDVYPGVDVVFYGTPSRLEHDFVVAPEANPYAIVLTSLALETSGSQIMATSRLLCQMVRQSSISR